jgi:hypothetical protein
MLAIAHGEPVDFVDGAFAGPVFASGEGGLGGEEGIFSK